LVSVLLPGDGEGCGVYVFVVEAVLVELDAATTF
jgi:hypothetical protein